MDDQIAIGLIQDEGVEGYEAIEDGVDAGHFKLDITDYYSVFLRKSDNTYWQVNYQISYNYGLDEESIYFYQVEKKEVVTTVWVAKND
jgi:hypothetical protein